MAKERAKSEKSGPMLLFGSAGVPEDSPKPDTQSGIAYVKELGLECMELEFVRGVTMREAKAAKVKATADELGVSLTVHAPYYINFNSHDPKIVEASKKRLYDSARIGALCGAGSVAFHPGFYVGVPPAQAFKKIAENLKEVSARCRDEGIDIQLRPETTGKPSQFGRLDEMIALSAEIEGVMPCVDFAHLHAYEGKINSYDEFAEVLDTLRRELGPEALADMHIHTSGIHFGQKGEIKHLNLEESDMNYADLMRALKDFEVGGRLVCESPDRAADALLMKNKYRRLRKRKIPK
jgi:deoxyribonuclease-4